MKNPFLLYKEHSALLLERPDLMLLGK